MKINIGNVKGIEVRTYTRVITTTELVKGGEVIASGEAILKPGDSLDPVFGAKLSAIRAVDDFFDQAGEVVEDLRGRGVSESVLERAELLAYSDHAKAAYEVLTGLEDRMKEDQYLGFGTYPGPQPHRIN